MAIVADDHCIINTMGVRFIEKINSTGIYRNDTQPFQLRVTYKGNQLTYSYADEFKRDSQYNALRDVMTSIKRIEK